MTGHRHTVSMSDFFPSPPTPPEPEDEASSPEWLNPPDDTLPGVVAYELIIGQSATAAVVLTGMRAYPVGVSMKLGVHIRKRHRTRDLNSEVFDGPYRHDCDDAWQRGRLKWGLEFVDGTRVTNLDNLALISADRPVRPTLTGGGGSSSNQHAERDYWLWPLPPAGPAKIVCQWLDFDIERTTQQIDTALIVEAANRAVPLWR